MVATVTKSKKAKNVEASFNRPDHVYTEFHLAAKYIRHTVENGKEEIELKANPTYGRMTLEQADKVMSDWWEFKLPDEIFLNDHNNPYTLSSPVGTCRALDLNRKPIEIEGIPAPMNI